MVLSEESMHRSKTDFIALLYYYKLTLPFPFVFLLLCVISCSELLMYYYSFMNHRNQGEPSFGSILRILHLAQGAPLFVLSVGLFMERLGILGTFSSCRMKLSLSLS